MRGFLRFIWTDPHGRHMAIMLGMTFMCLGVIVAWAEIRQQEVKVTSVGQKFECRPVP